MNLELKEIAAFLAAVAGGGFALWRWTVDQKWRRLQYAQSLIKEFFERKNIAKAFEVIDTIGEVEFEDDSNPTKRITINITNDFLISALTTFDQKNKNTYEEIILRDIFDDLFDGISLFQSHIDIGLIKLQDIRPYLDYWIKELSGHGKIHSKKVARQISRYLIFFGYDQALRFARDMGYPFKDHDPESSEIVKRSPDS